MPLPDDVGRCLPVPPTVTHLEVLRVDYCAFRQRGGQEIAHRHEVYLSADTGEVLFERCTLGEALT